MSSTTADPTTQSATDGPDLAPLIAALPEGAVITKVDSMAGYRMDWAKDPDAGTPLLVVRATCTEDVATAITFAAEHGISVVPRGAGTGLSGGASALEGCMVLSTERMRDIRVDPVTRTCVVQPGLLNAEVKRACAEHDLWYPPDPSSYEICSIGGNIATNAGGLCCVKYGVTADFVRGLEVVTAGGELLRTGRRTAKGVAGYDLTRLVVGSEGTLGVITQATLGLRPPPEPALTMAAVFADTHLALDAATQIMASGLRPSLMEFLDGTTIRAIQDHRDMDLPVTARAVLLTQSDRGPLAAADVAAMAEAGKDLGAVDIAVADDEDESALLLEARRLVGPALDRLGATLVDDVAVPRSRLIDLLAGIERIADQHSVVVACPGHIGDGNMHPTVVFDRGDDAAVARAREAFADIMRLALDLGGTITGEHGVGLLKREWLRREVGDLSYELQRSIKAAFDPLGILNPGKVL